MLTENELKALAGIPLNDVISAIKLKVAKENDPEKLALTLFNCSFTLTERLKLDGKI